jgi:hypothetical protein
MFDAAIIIDSVRMLVAAVTLVLFLFLLQKHHLAPFIARILRLNAFARNSGKTTPKDRFFKYLADLSMALLLDLSSN